MQMALLVIPRACLSECWSNDMARAHSKLVQLGCRAAPSSRIPQSVVCAQCQCPLAMGDKDPWKVDRPSQLVKPRALMAQLPAWLCYHCYGCLAGDLHDQFGMSIVANCCRLIGQCSHITRQ